MTKEFGLMRERSTFLLSCHNNNNTNNTNNSSINNNINNNNNNKTYTIKREKLKGEK